MKDWISSKQAWSYFRLVLWDCGSCCSRQRHWSRSLSYMACFPTAQYIIYRRKLALQFHGLVMAGYNTPGLVVSCMICFFLWNPESDSWLGCGLGPTAPILCLWVLLLLYFSFPLSSFVSCWGRYMYYKITLFLSRCGGERSTKTLWCQLIVLMIWWLIIIQWTYCTLLIDQSWNELLAGAPGMETCSAETFYQ